MENISAQVSGGKVTDLDMSGVRTSPPLTRKGTMLEMSIEKYPSEKRLNLYFISTKPGSSIVLANPR